jgi:hypothetical protein
MSKKSRRARRPNLPPEAFNMPTATATAPRIGAQVATNGTSAPAATQGQRRVTNINWQEEYGDVLGDLKRTAILAVAMMVAMGVLSIFIR